MKIVVVETWKPLCIKGISLQHPYNQGAFASIIGSHVLGCTQVVTQKLYKTRLSAHLQLQQQTLI